jgi:hypothetical protein
MNIPKSVSSLVFVVMSAILVAETPYATIAYAEGNRFSVIRAGKSVSYDADSPEVIGLAIERGDILQTAADTYLEVLIRPISASVQLAENTTFRCNADESGAKSEGELYYGRVRAKVSKLTGSSSYRITSPALVAGVRGTDFGCDHFYVKPPAPDAAAGSAAQTPVLNRVFCFEGSVLVVPAAAPELETVMIGGGEMVENTAPTVVAASKEPLTLVKAPVAADVTEFWKGREFHSSPAEPRVEEAAPLTEEKRQEIAQEIKRERNHKVRLAGSVALLLAGSLVLAPAYGEYESDGMTKSVMASSTFGGVLVVSSLGLLIYDLIKH